MSTKEPDADTSRSLVDELRQLKHAIAKQREQADEDAALQVDAQPELRRALEEALESGVSAAADAEHELVGELELLRAALDDAANDVEPVAAVLCARLQVADRLCELQRSVESDTERSNAERAKQLALELNTHLSAADGEERASALLARRATLSALLARLSVEQQSHNERLQTLSEELRSASQSAHELQVCSDTASTI